jgi:hypothetical protein
MKKVLLVSGLVMCSVANAADESTAPSFRMGDVAVFPGLGLVVKNDSNVYRQKSATASVITVLSPSVMFKADKEALTTSLAYLIDIASYSKDAADNYTDQKVLGQVDYELSSRSSLQFTPTYMIGHDDRGSLPGAGLGANPNKWTTLGVGGLWTYGAEEARMRTVLELGYNDRNYDNNRTVTATNPVATTGYDKTLTSVGGTAYFRMMPKTSLVLHAKNTDINYKASASLLDGTEQRLMAGLKWEASAQTTGEVKVGQVQKSYSTAANTTFSGSSWEGLVRWSPVSFLNVDLFSSKAPVETTLAGSKAINLSNTGVMVAYNLNDRVTLKADGSQVKEEFVGVTRSDSTDNFSVKAEYQIRSWLIGEAGYTSSTKTSNQAGADFSKAIFAVGIRSAL